MYGQVHFSPEMAKMSVTEDGNTVAVSYIIPDGLVVINRGRKYVDFDAYEWVTWYENTGTKPTQILSQIYDCDVSILFPSDAPRAWTAFIPDQESVVIRPISILHDQSGRNMIESGNRLAVQ